MRPPSPRLIAVLIGLGVFALLELATQLRWIDRYVIVPPSEMVLILRGLLVGGEAWAPIAKTSRVLLMAVGLSVCLGFAAGQIIHRLPRFRMAIEPVFTSYYAVPIFVFYPVFIVMFGLNDIPLVLVGALFGIIAMTVATLNALDRIPSVYLKSARVMRIGARPTLLRVVLPAMLPHLMIGLKLAVAYSLIGVVAGEFILATEGVGFRIAYAYNNFETPKMYAYMLLVLLFAVAVNGVILAAEARMARRVTR